MPIIDNPFAGVNREKLKMAEDYINSNEAKTIRCGFTGNRISDHIHVGYLSISKLTHTVESKFSARSIGDYSLKFNQPVRGKRKHEQSVFFSSGKAQKLGGMEITALIARNLPYFLFEQLNIKSDRVESNSLFVKEEKEIASLRPRYSET
jgi:DNA-directed RNA polymerase beta subunit